MSLQSLIAAAEQSHASGLALGAGRIGELLTALAIVRELGAMAEVADPIDTREGLERRLSILLTAAQRAAQLSETQRDDQFVAIAREELMVPEVLDFVAYSIRRAKQARAGG